MNSAQDYCFCRHVSSSVSRLSSCLLLLQCHKVLLNLFGAFRSCSVFFVCVCSSQRQNTALYIHNCWQLSRQEELHFFKFRCDTFSFDLALWLIKHTSEETHQKDASFILKIAGNMLD